MRMLKSGLKLVLDLNWIFDKDSGDLANLVVNHNTYDGVVYWQKSLDMAPILAGFDVKLPLNHRYIMTYYFPSDDYSSTIAFDTFDLEERYKVDADANSDQVGYQALLFWYYNADDEGVSAFDSSFIVANYGIRLNPVYMDSYNLRIYQID